MSKHQTPIFINLRKHSIVQWSNVFGVFTGQVKCILNNPNGYRCLIVIPEGHHKTQTVTLYEDKVESVIKE